MRSFEFKQDYTIKEKIGKGGFSEVFRCEHKRSKKVFAVKKMLRSKLSERDVSFLREEVKMLTLINKHTDRVIRMHDFYEENAEFLMVLEYLPGGDLFDRIHNKQTYNEEEARHYVQSLLRAVKDCHDIRLVHRDLKPENLLVKHDAKDMPGVKLADLGFATIAENDNSLTAGCGTMHYVAPEILRNKPYGRPVDLWSCGVIAYIMLGGYPPFYAENKKALVEKIKLGAFKFHDKTWGNVSPLAKDLIRRLLVVKPENRLTADEALRHEWMKIPGRTLSFVDLSENLTEFKKFNARRKFRAYVRTVMAVNRLRFVLSSMGIRPSAMSVDEVHGHGEADLIRQVGGAARPRINLSSSSLCDDAAELEPSEDQFMPPAPPSSRALRSYESEYVTESVMSNYRFGYVHTCKHIATGKMYEVKVMIKIDRIHLFPFQELLYPRRWFRESASQYEKTRHSAMKCAF